MLINKENLSLLFHGFKASFNKGFSGAETAYKTIAMVVPSATSEETYGWLGQFPQMREWVGSRVIQNLMAHSYKIVNKDFEQTISVPRNDIEDDKYGIFAPMFQEMGRTAAETPDQLVFDLLANGFSQTCYDGQYFFDADHPVGNGEAAPTSQSNVQAGAGAAWYLLDCSRAVKPMIFQERRPLNNLVNKTAPTDDNVFWNKEYIYGGDGRCNVGFGLWQLAYASKAPLTAANYALARAAMMNRRGDSGRPLGIRPDTLVVDPGNESAALKILNSENAAGGETNEWKGTAKLLVTPWANAT